MLATAAWGAAFPSIGRPVADFSLTERSDRTVTTRDLRGDVWVADFIFTRCPDACWNMTQALVSLSPLLKQHRDLRFVSFTIDPDFDRPPVLRKYADLVHASPGQWLFLTGPMADITRVAHSFLLATLTPDTDVLSHSTEFAVVDRHGIIRGYYDLDDPHCVPQLRQAVLQQLSRR